MLVINGQKEGMQMKRMLFVVNPKAGKSEIKNHLLEIIDVFVKAEWQIEVKTTQYAGHMKDIIQDSATDYDMVVCAGGDGTLNEAVKGMIAGTNDTPLGYLPVGTTNDFANSIGLPRNVIKAAEIAADGKAVFMDAGQLNQQPFVYVAAFGAFTKVSYETSQELKNLLGRTAYILEGIRSLSELKSYHMVVDCDNQDRIEGEFIFGMVSNATSVGGFQLQSKENVDLQDGLLELLMVRTPQNILDLNEIIVALQTNNLQDNPHLVSRQVKSLRFQSEDSIAWTCDGEFGGQETDSEITVLPKAYRIVLPKEI